MLGERGAVRSVARAQLEHTAPSPCPERTQDRAALQRLVRLGERAPGVGVADLSVYLRQPAPDAQRMRVGAAAAAGLLVPEL